MTTSSDTSVAEEAAAAGWSPADIEWEQKQERAATLALEDAAAAAALWAECLRLAQAHFSVDDPRLGASYINAAAGAEDVGAVALRQSGVKVWAHSAAWVDHIKPERRARSSLHHFRMEAKNRRIYETAAKQKMHDFAAAARAMAAGTLARDAAGEDLPRIADRCLRQWQREKPPMFGDNRKLLSACLLLMAGEKSNAP